MTPALPSNRADFLDHGLELAECSICREPFDVAHWPYQIRDCGHVFGKICLEAWLEQSDTQGTCPQCRGILFATETEPEIESDLEWGFDDHYEPESPRVIEARTQFRALQNWHLGGSILRSLDIFDPDGFLVKLWKEMVNAFRPDERELSANAWLPRITGLVRYLLEGLGLPDDHFDRTTLALQLDTYNIECVAFWGHTNRECAYRPFVNLSRDMIELARVFPRHVIPDPTLWRALISFESVGRGEPNSLFYDLQQCDELMLTRSTLISDPEWLMLEPNYTPTRLYCERFWRRIAAYLYFLLVLMAQDCKHNLGPNDVYNAEDVARLVRTLDTPIASGRSSRNMGMFQPRVPVSNDFLMDFCERAARFHHGAQINNPQTVPSKELADPRTRCGLIFCHARGFWLAAKTPNTVAYDATDDHMRFGIEQGFAGADGDDNGTEAGDDVLQ